MVENPRFVPRIIFRNAKNEEKPMIGFRENLRTHRRTDGRTEKDQFIFKGVENLSTQYIISIFQYIFQIPV